MLAAMGRAVHLLAYGHRALVHDWLAYPLLGPEADTYLDAGHRLAGDSAVEYATWHAARVRLTEDWLAASRAQQYVILGAGLDSFAWRHGGAVHTHEFDHPATQAWKRARLEKLLVPWPESVALMAADFESESVADALRRSTVDFGRPLFVSWLGVIPYLTTDAIVSTLRQLPPCTAAISYALPLEECDAASRAFAESIAEAVAAMGEPFLTLTTPDETQSLLEAGGFRVDDDLGADDVADRFGLACISYERIALAHKR